MSEAIAHARNARERLAQGLAALQEPGLPDQVTRAAEPVAKAMSALHEIESCDGDAVLQQAQVALAAVRSALGQLQQPQPVPHSAVDQAVEAVAGSLKLVNELAGSQPESAPRISQQPPSKPAVAPSHPQAAQDQVAQAQPAPGPSNGQSNSAPAPVATRVKPAVDPAALAATVVADADPPSRPPVRISSHPRPRASQVIAVPTQDLLRADAELGAHSPTNFYKGLSGNDVVSAGGIFVATYQIPAIGQELFLTVTLPGGYEFSAKAQVMWTRDTAGAAGEDASPGFGARFTDIDDEGRQLIYRYARNREPLFHDDF